MLDSLGFDFEVFKRSTNSFPNCRPFFTFCKIKIGYQFAEPLMGEGGAVFIIIFDYFLLVRRTFFNRIFMSCVAIDCQRSDVCDPVLNCGVLT